MAIHPIVRMLVPAACLFLSACIYHPSYPEEWHSSKPLEPQSCHIEGVYRNLGSFSENSWAYWATSKPNPEHHVLTAGPFYERLDGLKAAHGNTLLVGFEQPTEDQLLLTLYDADKIVFQKEFRQSDGDFSCTENGLVFTDVDIEGFDLFPIFMYGHARYGLFRDRDGALVTKGRFNIAGLTILGPFYLSQSSWLRYPSGGPERRD